ncbi:EpsG family protein [Bacteroides congonensis]
MFLTYLESKGALKNGMLTGFVVLTAVMSLRFEYGNDYVSYAQKFVYDGNMLFKFSDLANGTITEPIWFLLNRLFQPFGFQIFVAFLTIINSIAYYNLIKTNLPKNLWVFGLFIYLFTNSFFPMQLSMMRQALAMALIIFAVPYILEKKRFVPLLLLAISVGIHSSAIICIPFILLLYLNFTKRKTLVICGFFALFVLFFAAKDIILGLMSTTLNSFEYLQKYDEKYLLGDKYEASAAKSIFGLVLYIFPVVISLLYLRNCKDEKKIKYIVLYLLGSFIFLTNEIVPMAGRLAWYFTIFSIVALPISFSNIKARYVRYACIFLFVLITVKEYNDFFHALNWKDAFLEFRTIFS